MPVYESKLVNLIFGEKMKSIIATVIILIFSACSNNTSVLKKDTLFCKTISGFQYNSSSISYMLNYGADRGMSLYNQSRGCKTLPKYTSYEILEKDIPCLEKTCLMIKTELKEIGYARISI